MIPIPDLNGLLVFTIAVAGAGFGAGFVGGLFGGGGGMVAIPALYHVFGALGVVSDVRMHLVIGTSLAAVIPLSILGARTHWRQGNVDVSLLKRLAPTALLGSLAAGFIGHRMDANVLAWLFAVVAALTAWRMVARSIFRAVSHASRKPVSPDIRTLGLVGLGIGCVSTLVGVGGATLTVPALNLMGTNMRSAIGTSATLGMAIAIPGALSFALTGSRSENLPLGSLGHVNLIAATMLFTCGSLGVSIGARLTKRVDEELLRRLFSALLVASAIRMVLATS